MLDQAQRLEALNTQKSFIVQSPAGSGKTELLVQRYLALLSQSQYPENVIAITFTKKAAAEMRRRVLTALQEAALLNNDTAEAQDNTRIRLAKKLYQWQAQHHWNLLDFPNRLRIQTIDAFYMSLVAQTPLLSGLGTVPKISKEPTLLYQQAIHSLLTQLETSGELSAVLSHFLNYLDNDYSQVEALLMPMLSHRDQWIRLLEEASDLHALRAILEASLSSVRETRLHHVERVFANCEALPKDWREQLQSLLVFSKSNLTRVEDEFESKTPELDLLDCFWESALSLLLTSKNKWRSKVTNREGFPSEKEVETKEEGNFYAVMKQKFKALITLLSNQKELLSALVSFRQAPSPCYTQTQWQWLKTLFYILKVLAQRLQIVFQTHNQIDHVEVSLRALKAIGNEQAPTDLMLALDYQIQHILIDEFQDTSVQQLEFLTRLVEGWQPQDGRTLFLVGDPMQSIYRFRKAEVDLFRRVIEHGIGHCHLDLLILSTNFRSIPSLVHWINQHFSGISKESVLNRFSPAEAYSFHRRSNNLPSEAGGAHTHWLMNASEAQEAQKVVALTKEALQSSENIAILARTRRHLVSILIELKLAGIPFHAVEIAPFTQNPVVQDLLALTRALTHLADETAWFALLRAPWCGLSLKDLYIIKKVSHHTSASISPLIWENLLLLQDSDQLSVEGTLRLKRIMPCLESAIKQKGRMPLHTLVKQTWVLLGGPASLEKTDLLEESLEIEFFFQYIAQKQIGEDIVDFNEFEESLEKFYAKSQGGAAKVSVMTIHKAKGLEFDTVILPSLHQSKSKNSKALLLYEEQINLTEQGSRLVIAPLQPKIEQEEIEPIYHYLEVEDQNQNQAEAVRLLYVACTRAKRSLHLVGVLQSEEKSLNDKVVIPPKSGSFLSMLWPYLEQNQKVFTSLSTEFSETLSNTFVKEHHLQRIVLASDPQGKISSKQDKYEPLEVAPTSDSWQWEATSSKQIIGIVTHQLLYTLAQEKLSESALFEQRFNLIDHYQVKIPSLLLQAKLNPKLVEESLSQVIQSIRNILEDPRGRWILSNYHRVARSEYALTCINKVENKLQSQRFIIDRTFIDDQGIRWIIDYKTTDSIKNESVSSFIKIQQVKHQAQLERYAKALKILEHSADTSIRLGLYWPALKLWHEWAF